MQIPRQGWRGGEPTPRAAERLTVRAPGRGVPSGQAAPPGVADRWPGRMEGGSVQPFRDSV